MPDNDDELRREIAILEHRLHRAQSRLRPDPRPSSTHFLLLLADSALPIGSFAFSSGLESYVAHSRRPGIYSFSTFLPLSLTSIASSALPYVLAAHRTPSSLASLDDHLDASTLCLVSRRASTSQGRALLSVWERSYAPATNHAAPALVAFAAQLKRTCSNDGSPGHMQSVSAHLPPLFGAISSVVGLTLHQTAYVFLLSHVKALVSAAVRANLFGPYHAQKLLAGDDVQRLIHAVIDREWSTQVEDAAQTVPVVDLWIGRHEMLYSRIFNS